MNIKREWFGEWFNSPYYHILYKHRDYEEAALFIDNLNKLFGFKPDQKALDLACGKGRHAIYLNKVGLDVVGVDLSPKNIAEAKKHENEKLHFYVHDMREVFHGCTFDYVFNLFTSFGYFQTEAENEKAIAATASSMKKGGYLIIDFLNPTLVINNMVPCEEKTIDGIHFKISRMFSNGYILKDIEFETKEKAYQFQERVQAIKKEDFLKYFKMAGLTLTGIYGEYTLTPFDEGTSGRMIFIAQK